MNILENYLKESSLAVLKVAEAVENFKGREALSLEEAACLSVAMYGAPPKPSAKNVAAVVKQRGVADKELSDEVLLKMSMARRGQENNKARADIAANDICTIMEDVTGKGFKYSNRRDLADGNERVYIGMLNDTTAPVVVRGRYKMHTDDKPKLNEEAFQNSKTTVANNLNEILKDVQNNQQQQQQQQQNDLKSFVTSVVNNVNLTALVAWADSVENAIRTHNNNNNLSTPSSSLATGPSCVVDEITSRNSSVVKTAVHNIYSLVGNSYCRTVTQLTSVQDILGFKKAADTCFDALMTDTWERIIVSFLFYVNFKVVEGDSQQEFVKQRLASMAGNRKPLVIARRTAKEILFGTCFLLKVMGPEFVSCILNFTTLTSLPPDHLSSIRLAFIENYGPPFNNSWSIFNEVLQQRGEAVKSQNRIDTRDASSNLTGSVYVLVLDLARTLTHQRTCSRNFLDKITEQCLLWNKFVEEKS